MKYFLFGHGRAKEDVLAVPNRLFKRQIAFPKFGKAFSLK
jgi:hypothetical protein